MSDIIGKDSLELQKLLTEHLSEGLQKLEDLGIELVLIGGRAPLFEGTGTVGIAGTVKTAEHAFLLLVQAVKEMQPNIELTLPGNEVDALRASLGLVARG